MPSDEFGDKTEEATPRRREEARRKGDVARSTDLNAAGHMLAAAAVMYFFGASMTHGLAELLQASLGGAAWLHLDQGMAHQHMKDVLQFTAGSVLPMLMLMMIAAVFVNVAQVGFLLTPDALQPRFSRLNPIQGAQKILSISGLVRLATSLVKLIILIAIAAGYITFRMDHWLGLQETEPQAILLSVGQSLAELAVFLAIALMILALLDFAFQKWKFLQDLRMSKQEVREEFKQMEGDPHIRQRRREAHQKLAQAREIQQVEDADVVITNPTHVAVALKYDVDTMPAPMVVAKGMGAIAQRIREVAAEHRVPIIERPELARSLYRTVKVGQPIPAELYEVFVEIMAYVYRLTGHQPEGLS